MIGFSSIVFTVVLVTLDPILSAPPEPRGPICKNPKGPVGAQYIDDCIKFTCIKANKKTGVWSQGPAIEECCFQGGTGYENESIISLTTTNCTLTKLVCEVSDGFASIAASTQITCPSTSQGFEEIIEEIRENIEEVKTEIDDNEAKLDLIPGKIEEVKTEVDVNEAKLDLIPGKIEEVKTEVDINEAKLNLIPGKIEEVSVDLKEVKEIFEDIRDSVTDDDFDIIVWSSGYVGTKLPDLRGIYEPYGTYNFKPQWKMPNQDQFIWFDGHYWNLSETEETESVNWIASIDSGDDLPPDASNIIKWVYVNNETDKVEKDDPTLQFYRFKSSNDSSLSTTGSNYGTSCSGKNTSDSCKSNTKSCPCLPLSVATPEYCSKCCIWCGDGNGPQCVYHQQCLPSP